MPRFFNTVTRTEAIEGIHPTNVPEVVILPDDNPFWHPLPSGKRITFDYNGVPNGIEDIPPPVYTPLEQAAVDLRDAGVTVGKLTLALYAAERGHVGPFNNLSDQIDAIAAANNLSVAETVMQVL